MITREKISDLHPKKIYELHRSQMSTQTEKYLAQLKQKSWIALAMQKKKESLTAPSSTLLFEIQKNELNKKK